MEIPKRFKEMMDELSKGMGKIHDAKPVEGKEGVVSGIMMFYPSLSKNELTGIGDIRIPVLNYVFAFSDRMEWDTRFYEVHNYLQE